MSTDNLRMASKRGKHRQRITPQGIVPFNLLIARPVGRSEYLSNPDAMIAYWKEWNNLETKGVWKWDSKVEWKTVADTTRENPTDEAHFGYLFGIMVEKGLNLKKVIHVDTISIALSFKATTLRTKTG
jgi:hypothetical protein